MTVTVFANVTTTGRRYLLFVNPDRHGVSAVITHDLGCNFRTQARSVKKLTDIPFYLIARSAGPVASKRLLELKWTLLSRHTLSKLMSTSFL